jgi:hypothetical protein
MYRLPSIVAFALTLVAVFLFVRHVAGAWSGAAAAAMLLPTQLFTVHAVDARPYALVACAVAWAAVMWQRAERGGRFVLGFGFLLAFAVSLHYYAVAVWLPFTAAELTRWRRTTTLRPSVWLALAFGLLPLAGFWPLVAAMRAEFGPHVWARPPIAGFLRAYDTLLNLSLVGRRLVDRAGGYARGGGGSAGGGAVPTRSHRPKNQCSRSRCSSCRLMYVAADLAGVGIVGRYLAPALIGFALAVAFVTAHSRLATAIVIALSLGVAATRQLEVWYIGTPLAREAIAAEQRAMAGMVSASGHPDLPLAIASALSFLPLAHYDTSGTLRSVYLADRAAAVRYAGTDTAELLLQRAARVLPIPVQDADDFLASHDRLLVYAGTDRYDWLPSHLAARGYRLESVARLATNERVLYLAERRPLRAGCCSLRDANVNRRPHSLPMQPGRLTLAIARTDRYQSAPFRRTLPIARHSLRQRDNR